jgi:hypothetical protein
MMKNLVKPIQNIARPAAFSTYKVKGAHTYANNATDANSSNGYMKQDAERTFDQFFKENPLKESERSFFNMDYNEAKQ